MSKRTSRALSALGLAVALFGVAVDWLWPDASPGINLPQAILIVSGLATAYGARYLRLRDIRFRLAGRALGCAVTSAVIAILTLLAIEIVLVISGWSTYFPRELQETDVTIAPWWGCDELGCRYEYEAAKAACDEGLISGRHCKVNRQGFGDSKDFVTGDDFSERTRILLLGDSFTQGFSADIGSSFGEILEAQLPEAVVWNAAISASGTSQALATFEGLAPRLRPQVTVLGFYMNDFAENLIPLNGLLQLQDSEGRLHNIRRYYVDKWGSSRQMPLEKVFAYIAAGSRPPANEAERIIGLTRLGSLAIRLTDRLSHVSRQNSLEYQKQLTRQYLTQLRDAAIGQDSLLLVLLIPAADFIDSPDERYATAIELMEELAIPYVSLAPMLVAEQDYEEPPDSHWNNAGHRKVGELLSECMAVFSAGYDLASCDRVITP